MIAMDTQKINSTSVCNDAAVFATDLDEAGKGGEGGVSMMTNGDFVAAVFPSVPEGAFAAVCSKAGDPDIGGWVAGRAIYQHPDGLKISYSHLSGLLGCCNERNDYRVDIPIGHDGLIALGLALIWKNDGGRDDRRY